MHATEKPYTPPPKPTRKRGRMRITLRDRHLLIAVGMARHLSYGQLHHLFFPRWTPNSVKARLRELCGLGERPATPAALQRVGYFEPDGKPVSAYCLTPAGEDLARDVLPELVLGTWTGEANDSLKHNLGIAEVFVQLAAATASAATGFPDMTRLPFRWTVGVRLPFEDSDFIQNTRTMRVLIPDVILELPALRRRLLIEYETGSQPIVARALKKRGAASHKLERWNSFLFRQRHGQTAYQRRFPDGLFAEVHFVTAREPRASSLRKLIDRCKKDREIVQVLNVIALERSAFIERVLEELNLVRAQVAEAPPSKRRKKNEVNTAERAVMRAFYNESVDEVTGSLHTIRSHNQATNAKLAEPKYPASALQMRELVVRLT